ncbi:MAG: dinitrogenase iron-molybdenum cofactor biosynthesis protein [Thermoproteota archaeon]|nr:MAG: dinitrogenase iron-molybdenum cofactor biosynthesis protein [Candidatus Korarchaeota archaeon]
MPKIAIASNSKGGLEDVVASRFGRAPTFTIIELDDKGNIINVKVIENPGVNAPGGAGVKAVQALINEGVDIAVGPSFGPNAKAILDEMNIKAITIPAGTKISEAIEYVKREIGLA